MNSTRSVTGSVLCEHVRSIDYRARKLIYVELVSSEELEEIVDIINGIIEV